MNPFEAVTPDRTSETIPSSTAAAAAGARLVAVTVAAPRVALDAFLSLDLEGAPIAWDSGERWSFAGRGAAACISARGEGALARCREALARVQVSSRDEDEGETPSLRWFGGSSFAPGSCAGDPWTGMADAYFVLPKWLYAVSRDRAVLRVVVPEKEARPWRARAERLAAALRSVSVGAAPSPSSSRPLRAETGASVRGNMPPDAWARLVDGALAEIRSGRFLKLVVARRTEIALGSGFSLVDAAARLAALEPSCTRYMVDLGGAALFGATPERLVSVSGLRVVAEALAGSGARLGEDATDATEHRALLASDKDRREHAHVVDGIRDALGPLCDEVDASSPIGVRSLARLHHLFTPIEATLRRRTHVLDVVAALHPTPAVCGLPRARAGAWIAGHEPVTRGYYAAPVGWVDEEGNGTFAVAIRSVLVRGDRAFIHAGAGIVEGSTPESEYRETALKQASLLAALGVSPFAEKGRSS